MGKMRITAGLGVTKIQEGEPWNTGSWILERERWKKL